MACLQYLYFAVITCRFGVFAEHTICQTDMDCGWNAKCMGQTCQCLLSYKWAGEKHIDCLDISCGHSNCVTCKVDGKCLRCLHYMDSSSGDCIDTCSNTFHLSLTGSQQGRICEVEGKKAVLSDVQLAIICGVTGGLLLSLVLGLAFYCRIQRTKGAFDIPDREIIDAYSLSSGSVRTIQGQRDGSLSNGSAYYANGSAYGVHLDPANTVSAGISTYEEKEEFIGLLGELRPHMNTVLAMVNEARKKTHNLGADDPLLKSSRSVVHELCRVLTLLNKKEPEIMMPIDGVRLLKWTNKIMRKYLHSQRQAARNHSENTRRPNRASSLCDLPQVSVYESSPLGQKSRSLRQPDTDSGVVANAHNDVVGDRHSNAHNQSDKNGSQSVQLQESSVDSPLPYRSTSSGTNGCHVVNESGIEIVNKAPVSRQASTQSEKARFSTFGYERVTSTDIPGSGQVSVNPRRDRFGSLPRNFAYSLDDNTESILV